MTTFATLSIPATVTVPPRERAFGQRMRGLDGLRAIAVALVIVFHLQPGIAVGGYLGVDVFFVISGFLITGLLLREKRRTGTIHFGRFWMRRARRLLPPLAVVLVVSSSIALVLGGDVLVGLGRQLLGATTFSYNWLDIAGGAQYFNDSTPELFRNLWSLAVEEQFYLAWPLVVFLLALVRRTRLRVGIAIGVAALSLAAMVVLFSLTGDATRVYYGADTHSFGLAIGAALALMVDARPPSTWRLRTQRALVPIGVASLAGVIMLALYLEEGNPLVYRGGLAIVAVLTAITIAACIAPGSIVGRALAIEPLRWLGVRSFGLYLWHWPIYILFAVALPEFSFDNDGLQLLGGAAACLTVVAAALSYRFVEAPIRRLGFRAAAAVWWRRAAASRAGAWRAVVASALVFGTVSMTGMALIVAPTEGSMQALVEAGQDAVAHAPGVAAVVPPLAPVAPALPHDPGAAALPFDPAVPAEPPAPGVPGEPGDAVVAPPAPPTTAPVAEAPVMPTGDQITAIGDSVMLAVAPELQKMYPGIDIHAAVSRQLRAAPGIVEKLVKREALRPVILIGLGTNGPITESDLDDVLSIVGPDARVVLVNVQAPRDWTSGVNKQLVAFAAAHRNVELADWRAGIKGRAELLYADRIHPRDAAGGKIYTSAVTAAFERLVTRAEPVDMSNFTPTLP